MASFLSRLSSALVLSEQFFSGLRHRSIGPHQTESQISQSSRSDAAMLPVDADHSLIEIELGNQNALVNTETVPIETEPNRLQETAKLVVGFALGLSLTIIIAVVTNKKKLARKQGELILYEVSAGFALLCFFAGVGLLISVLADVRGERAERVMRRTQIGLIVVAVVSLIASVVAVAMNAVI